MVNIGFVLGTKAQFIKSKYVLKELVKNNFNLVIVDTGQHKEITKMELEQISENYDYVSVSRNSKNISSIVSMFFWFLKITLRPLKVEKLQKADYCIVHGDTLSTLIGLFIAKKNKVPVIHLESGFKSNNWFKPFPEEIIRALVTKFSEIIVIDSPEAEKNIKKYIGKKKIIRISRNTLFDSVVQEIKDVEIIKNNNLIVTIHRTENIYNKKLLNKFINLLIEIENKNLFDEIIWYCHDITFNALIKNSYNNLLIQKGIKLKKLLTHNKFILELCKSKSIITDGGSIAEECSILGLKTIIWRDLVENIQYLNKNVILSNYDSTYIFEFLNMNNLNTEITKFDDINLVSPSKEFVEELINL